LVEHSGRGGDLAVYGVYSGLIMVQELGVWWRAATRLQWQARAVPVHNIEDRRV
jgi:hypothetical protein